MMESILPVLYSKPVNSKFWLSYLKK